MLPPKKAAVHNVSVLPNERVVRFEVMFFERLPLGVGEVAHRMAVPVIHVDVPVNAHGVAAAKQEPRERQVLASVKEVLVPHAELLEHVPLDKQAKAAERLRAVNGGPLPVPDRVLEAHNGVADGPDSVETLLIRRAQHAL